MNRTLLKVILGSSLVGAVVGMNGCPSEPAATMDMAPGGCPGIGAANPAPGATLKGPSKSSTIAISDDDATVGVVNTENASVTFFNAATNAKIATVNVGKEPSSIVIAPDKTTAWVANRADATVQKITGINTPNPVAGAPIDVGSEPTGLALSPSGGKLLVAEFAESSIGIVDTNAGCRVSFVSNVRNPRSITVTNNGDANDNDETVIVPEFYGEPQTNGEGQNNGRLGKVHLYKLGDGSDAGVITLNPFNNANVNFETTTAPNQLYNVAVAQGKIFIPTVSASPAAPLNSRSNVYPVVYSADLSTKMQIGGSSGGPGSINLAESVATFTPPPARFFLAEIVDLAFVTNSTIAYVVSRGADAVQRVDFGASPPTIGSAGTKQIDVQGTGAMQCLNPTGIVLANTASTNKAFVNCWASRRMAVINLTDPQMVMTVVDSVAPAGLNTAVDRGRRFYFTGRGRWSGDGNAMTDTTENGSAWSSCGTCHPDGLSDNITWIFGSGPRQTTSMDGTFSHSASGGAQKQRVLNWTAINDEMHDFENNTRGVSGGKGAITVSASCGTLTTENRSTIAAAGLGVAGGANQTAKEIQDNTAMNCVKDFDDINEWVKTIRPPRGRRFLDQASVARGAALFGAAQGGCAKCHGGLGWTISNRFFTPSATNNGATGLPVTAFAGSTQMYSAVASGNANQISGQNLAADGATGAAIPPLQLSCALRNVGTFGNNGVETLEIRTPNINPAPAMNPNRAQGKGGYNVPSLYGLQLGAPYLHHGQASTLDALFTDQAWKTHWTSGSPNFLNSGNPQQDRTDIINFLLSIDSTTAEQAAPAGFAGGCSCPGAATSC